MGGVFSIFWYVSILQTSPEWLQPPKHLSFMAQWQVLNKATARWTYQVLEDVLIYLSGHHIWYNNYNWSDKLIKILGDSCHFLFSTSLVHRPME